MTKLTLEVDEGVAERVAEAAAELGVAPETLAAEVLAERFSPPRKLGFVSLGRSTNGRRQPMTRTCWLRDSAADPARRHQRRSRRGRRR